jgi:hypothetical protein
VSGSEDVDGTPIIAYDGKGKHTANEKFAFIPDKSWTDINPVYNITSALRGGRVIDGTGGGREVGAPCKLWTLHGGPNQQWSIVPIGQYVAFINPYGMAFDVQRIW